MIENENGGMDAAKAAVYDAAGLNDQSSRYYVMREAINNLLRKHTGELAARLTMQGATPLWDAVNSVLLGYGFFNPANSGVETEKIFALLREHIAPGMPAGRQNPNTPAPALVEDETRARLFGFIEVGAQEEDFPTFAAALDDYVHTLAEKIRTLGGYAEDTVSALGPNSAVVTTLYSVADLIDPAVAL